MLQPAMSTNPIDKNSTPKPTGSLEELFRHHLGEEAAVPPRPMLWDQIDNSLLIRQNEVYRKRLVATRWVAAASLLLATLAGTGWWSTHDSHLGEGTVATASRTAASGTGISAAENATAGRNSRRATGAASAANQAATSASRATEAASASLATAAVGSANGRGLATRDAATDGSATAYLRANRASSNAQHSTVAAASGNSASRTAGLGAGSANSGLNTTATTSYSTRYNSGTRAADVAHTRSIAANSGSLTAGTDAIAARTNSANNDAALNNARNAGAAGITSPASALALAATGVSATTATNGLMTSAAEGTAPVDALAQASVAAPEQVDLLAARTAALNMEAPGTLPNDLAALALPESEPAADVHRWHYGASYTAGVFNPNVNFSRAGIEHEHDYNPALGPDSPALTEAAATQYRQNLRPGLSQRIALLATRHLTGHWSLSTGAEFTQASAKSATATSFVGEQLPDLGQSSTGPLRTTDFRYRLASIPVEVRYTNPVKRGWSLYGRLGGVVSALLGVRSEVEGEPEATKTYSLLSAGMPYRRITGSVRGGMGAQFRTSTGKWALTMGPVAELGLMPLNAHPAQGYFAQSRPYSFGMEAGVEFGR